MLASLVIVVSFVMLSATWAHAWVKILVSLLPTSLCRETSTRDTANKRSLELCASIVHVFLDGCSEWYFSVVFLTGQVLGNWYL